MLKRRTFLLGSASALAVSRAASQVPGGEATVGGCFGAPANSESCQSGPVVAIDFTAAGFSPSSPLFTQNIAFSHTATGAVPTMFDATGTLTYGPNQLATQSKTLNNGAWAQVNSATVTANGSLWTISSTGTSYIRNTLAIPQNTNQILVVDAAPGSVNFITLSLPAGAGAGVTFQLTGAGTVVANYAGSTAGISLLANGSYRCFVVANSGSGTTGWPSIGPSDNTGFSSGIYAKAASGSTVNVVQVFYSVVTYETAPRPNDQVVTGATAYYGPRFPYAYNGAWTPNGFLVENAATNLYLNSGAPATQTVTVANATQYTTSLYNTGTLTLSGALTQVMTGSATPGTRATYTGTTATTSLVATDTSLTSTAYPQVELGSYATTPIINGASALTRNVDTVSATGPLAAAVAVGPSRTKTINEATGATAYTTYAAGAFPSTLPTGFYYQYIKAYAPGTNMAMVPN